MSTSSDCLILGGGVIGLSLAYELAGRGWSADLVDRGPPGREASWAGAGILPPAARHSAVDPVDRLRGLSHELHPRWAAALREETGIDTGYRECGGIYLARSAGEAAALHGLASMFRETGIAIQGVDLAELVGLEPALRDLAESGQLRAVYLLPGEAQLRNPDHLRALVAACQKRGVRIQSGVEVRRWVTSGGHVQAVETSAGTLAADHYCVAAGAWTYSLLRQLGIETGILPIRGQMVLFRCEQRPFARILNEGQRYLVPRDDGRVLVGSTEEEAGYDKSTTDEAVAELTEMAYQLVPSLRAVPIEKAWAGLRPGSFDGLPYLGRLPQLANAFVAAGHFRSGLHLSTGTAVAMADLISGQPPPFDLAPFQVGRGSAAVK